MVVFCDRDARLFQREPQGEPLIVACVPDRNWASGDRFDGGAVDESWHSGERETSVIASTTHFTPFRMTAGWGATLGAGAFDGGLPSTSDRHRRLLRSRRERPRCRAPKPRDELTSSQFLILAVGRRTLSQW